MDEMTKDEVRAIRDELAAMHFELLGLKASVDTIPAVLVALPETHEDVRDMLRKLEAMRRAR